MAITGRDSKGKFTGDGITKRLLALEAKFGTMVAGALYRRAQRIMADSKENYVPVDLSTLKNSGQVSPPYYLGRQVTVELSYGGAAAAYALAVHEHPSKYSPPSWQGVQVTFSPSGTGPKYLERPLMAAVSTLPADLAKDLNLERMV